MGKNFLGSGDSAPFEHSLQKAEYENQESDRDPSPPGIERSLEYDQHLDRPIYENSEQGSKHTSYAARKEAYLLSLPKRSCLTPCLDHQEHSRERIEGEHDAR